MEHFWQGVPGYFTFPDFYAWLARELPDGERLVEVGVYSGQSAACLLVELHNANKLNCRLDLVDTVDIALIGTSYLAPVKHLLGEIHVGESVKVAAKYADASLGAAFIDADHSYPSVRGDIDAWLPKVKPGGIIAGHDFLLSGVIEAVSETFKRVEVFSGIRYPGDGKHWPVWCTRVG